MPIRRATRSQDRVKMILLMTICRGMAANKKENRPKMSGLMWNGDMRAKLSGSDAEFGSSCGKLAIDIRNGVA